MQSNGNNMQQNGLSVTGIILKYMIGLFPEIDPVISSYKQILAQLPYQSFDYENIFATSLIEGFSMYRTALLSCMDMDVDASPSNETDYPLIAKELNIQEYRPGILTKEEEHFFADKVYDYLCQLQKAYQDIMAKVCRDVLSKPCNGNIYIASAPFPGIFLMDFVKGLMIGRDVCFHIVISDPLLRYIANIQLANFPYPYILYASEEEIGIEKFDIIIAFDPGTKEERVDEKEILRLHGMLNGDGELIVPVQNSYLAQQHLDECVNSFFATLIRRNAIKIIVQLPDFLSQGNKGAISILDIRPGVDYNPEDSYLNWVSSREYIIMVDAKSLDRYDFTTKYESFDGKETDKLLEMMCNPTSYFDYEEMLRNEEASSEAQEVSRYRIDKSLGILLPAYHLLYKFPLWSYLNSEVEVCPPYSNDCIDSARIVKCKNLNKNVTGIKLNISDLEIAQSPSAYRVICGPAVLVKYHADGTCETGIVGQGDVVAIEDGILAFAKNHHNWVPDEDELDVDSFLAYIECLLSEIGQDASVLISDSSSYQLTAKQVLYLPTKFRNKDEITGFVSRIIGNNIKSLQQEIVKQHEEYKRQVRIRKHAMSQTVSSLAATWNVLMSYMNQRGTLGVDDTIGVRHPVSAKSQIEKVSKLMTTLSLQTDHLTDIDYNWGEQLPLAPADYFLKYVSEHQNVSFKFDLSECNLTDKDGSIFMVAPEALDRVMSNVISNAQSHGFTDDSRKDYCIKIVWHRSVDSVSISISNNGTPLQPDMSESELTDYGVSSALNTDGHSGIGCSDIKSIVEQQGGTFEIKRHDGDRFPVEYILSFPRVTK